MRPVARRVHDDHERDGEATIKIYGEVTSHGREVVKREARKSNCFLEWRNLEAFFLKNRTSEGFKTLSITHRIIQKVL